jgi:hypothetical protein
VFRLSGGAADIKKVIDVFEVGGLWAYMHGLRFFSLVLSRALVSLVSVSLVCPSVSLVRLIVCLWCAL